MKLHDLTPPRGSTHAKKRVGRGHGSGHVKTSGRGTKGQKARTGGNIPATFEGGQTRLVARVPYRRGFRNAPFKTHYTIINLGRLDALHDGTEVTLESLSELGWVSKKTTGPGKFGGLKVLGDGTITKRLVVRAQRISASAKAKIVAAGGTAEEISVGSTESAGAGS
jgi:large subunit ribosomal protein L15